MLVSIVGLSGLTCNSGVASMAEMEPQDFKSQREQMVKRQLRARDIDDPRVLEVMGDVPRHLFVPASQVSQAYDVFNEERGNSRRSVFIIDTEGMIRWSNVYTDSLPASGELLHEIEQL